MKKGQSATGRRIRARAGQSVRHAGNPAGSSLGKSPIATLLLAAASSIAVMTMMLGIGVAGAAGTTGSKAATPATGAKGTAGSSTSTTSGVAVPQSPIDAAEARVAGLAAQISREQAVLDHVDELYNQAVVNLDATNASLQTTTASIAAGKAKLVSDRTHLRDDTVSAYIGDASSSAAAALFSAPTSASQIRTLYQTLGAAAVVADVARVKAGQQHLTATEAQLVSEQKVQTAQLAQESQARQSAEAISAKSEATLAQVKGSLAQQVAQQAATQATAAARAAASATTPAAAQAAAAQAAQAAQVASTVGSGSTAAVNAATAATQAAGSAAGGTGSGGAPVTISGGGAPQASGLAAVHGAMRYLGVPYLWGGMGAQGVDCSGLTALAWAQAGVSLPHSAADQYAVSRHVSMTALEPGDLLFYDFGGGIDHVAMYVGPTLDGHATAYGANTIIQAAHTGTIVSFYPYWSAGLVGAARP